MRTVFSVSLAFMIAVMLLLSSCGRATPPPSASEVLSAMLTTAEATAQPIPDGVIRLTAAPEGSPNYLTETFFSALYGEAARGLWGEDVTQRPPIRDAALYLSVAPYPMELGVFRCADESTAREVTVLCRKRLDTLSHGYGTEDASAIQGKGCVAVEGNWVLWVLCEDPAPVLEAARRLVG